MHIVIISFGYEPLAHVSAKRPSRMAEYLSKYSHEVTVITVDWRSPLSDEILSPEVMVRLADQNQDGMPRVIRVDPRSLNPSFDPLGKPRTTERMIRRSMTGTIRRFASRARWGSFPTWGKLGLRALIELHRIRPVDVCWAIHGDDTAHEIAARFARQTGVPWVADFKDAWDGFVTRRPARWLQEKLARRRLSSAVRMTETCEMQGRDDEARFARPVSVIWSGYDPEGIEAATPRRLGDDFSLAYFGHVSMQHEVHLVTDLFAALSDSRSVPKVKLHVFTSSETRFREAFESAGLSDRIRFHAYVPQREAFAFMRGADALLLLPATGRERFQVFVGVKELEYLASGSPVLVLGELLPEIRAVVPTASNVFEARTTADAVKFLTSLAPSHRIDPNASFVRRFSWSEQARMLSDVLLDAARQRKGGLTT